MRAPPSMVVTLSATAVADPPAAVISATTALAMSLLGSWPSMLTPKSLTMTLAPAAALARATVTAMVLPSRYPTLTPLGGRAVKLARQRPEEGLDELTFEVGEPGVRRDDGRVGVVGVEVGEVGVVGDADAGSEGETGVVEDAEPGGDVVGFEADDDPVLASGLGSLERAGEPFEGFETTREQLGVDELLPLLLGLLFGGVEV